MATESVEIINCGKVFIKRRNFDFSFIFLSSSMNITVLLYQIPAGIMLVIVLPKI